MVFGAVGYALSLRDLAVIQEKLTKQIEITSNLRQESLDRQSAVSLSETLLSTAVLENLSRFEGFTKSEFNPDLIWKIDTNWHIVVQSSDTIILHIPALDEQLATSGSYVYRLLESIDALFLASGFQKNDRNTGDSPDLLVKAYGYESDSRICKVELETQVSDKRSGFYSGAYEYAPAEMLVFYTNAHILCASKESLAQNKQIQVELIQSVLNYYGESSAQGSKYAVYIDEIDSTNRFVRVSVGGYSSGSYGLAVKNGGHWTMLYIGQDQPSCAVLREHQFPPEIHEACFE